MHVANGKGEFSLNKTQHLDIIEQISKTSMYKYKQSRQRNLKSVEEEG